VPEGWKPARPPGALTPAGQHLWLFHQYALAPACRTWDIGEGVFEYLDRVLPPEEGQKAFVQETVRELAASLRRGRRR
jgi:hypothetical protein